MTTAITPAASCAAKNASSVAGESILIRAWRRYPRHASKAKKASATRLAAAAAVARKSNGEASSGRRFGEAYALAEKIVASSQSAGEAPRKSNRPQTTATPAA